MNKKFILSMVTATLLASTSVYATTDYATTDDLDELQEIVDTIESESHRPKGQCFS